MQHSYVDMQHNNYDMLVNCVDLPLYLSCMSSLLFFMLAYKSNVNIFMLHVDIIILHVGAAAVAQWVRVFVSQRKSWVLESQLRHTVVAKTGSDSSTAKRSAKSMSVTGPLR